MVELYLACGSQWRREPDGRLAGLRYESVQMMAGWLGTEMTRATAELLLALEREAMKIGREKDGHPN